jgi:heat shock protein HtpX
MARTLPQQIAANRRAGNLWAFLLFVLLVALGTSIVGAYEPTAWPIGLAGSAVVGVVAILVATYGGSKIVLTMQGARPATPQEDQILRNVVEEMSIAAGVPMPKVYVIEDGAPNAFATGRDPQHGIIAVTTGLLQKLDRDELQGVVAHEMAHIRNYDIRFMTMVSIVAGTIPLLADAFMRMHWYGGGPRRDRDRDQDGAAGLQAVFMAVAVILSILAPIFAHLLEMAVSRQREYLADASAAELTRYPQGLASALRKIASDPDPLEVANRAVQHMYIVNPIALSGGEGLLSTHPPTEDRIRRLLSIGGRHQDPLAEPLKLQ